MSGIDHWLHLEELSVIQAALLMVGVNPAGIQDTITQHGDRPDGFDAAFHAIKSAILSKHLRANESHSAQAISYGIKPNTERGVWVVGVGVKNGQAYEVYQMPDWHLTTVRTDDLIAWLEKRGVYPEFFFPIGHASEPSCTNKKHPHYSPKLAAAFSAWMHFAKHPDSVGPKSLKAAMTKWIRSNAKQFDLLKPNGEVNELGVEEAGKIANWDTTGGAPPSKPRVRKTRKKITPISKVKRKP